MTIPFHRPYVIDKALLTKDLTRLFCDAEIERDLQSAFKAHTDYISPRFTGSATHALEAMALAMDFKPGDEVIIPSYTYVATANSFARAGATLVFADIETETFNLDMRSVENCITKRTKAIVPIHYGGIAVDLEALLKTASRENIAILEDAAHGLGATYLGKPLGSLGTMGCLSFHQTKNITSGGAGGCLLVNDPCFESSIDQIIHQGTNRADFLLGEVPFYQWQCLGGSLEMTAFSKLYLQQVISALQQVTEHRRMHWNRYCTGLSALALEGQLKLPVLPPYTQTNGHIFYILLNDQKSRDALKLALKASGIEAYTHYEPLHLAPAGRVLGKCLVSLINTEEVATRMLRLPLDAYTTIEEQTYVIEKIYQFYKKTP